MATLMEAQEAQLNLRNMLVIQFRVAVGERYTIHRKLTGYAPNSLNGEWGAYTAPNEIFIKLTVQNRGDKNLPIMAESDNGTEIPVVYCPTDEVHGFDKSYLYKCE
jgi:hypothetical protein